MTGVALGGRRGVAAAEKDRKLYIFGIAWVIVVVVVMKVLLPILVAAVPGRWSDLRIE